MKNTWYHVFVALFLCYGCNNQSGNQSTVKEKESEPQILNPASPGFNLDESDEQAIKIADEVMQQMGGRQAWDNMKTLSWNFFGARKLVWDKPSGNVNIDFLNSPKPLRIALNIHDSTKVQLDMDGKNINHPDSLAKYGKIGKSVWINDSYWVVMPFKLKDSGVTLQYARQDTTLTGEMAHVLQLTFTEVGDTPQNKYEVYVSKERKLVAQWAFFREKDQEKPIFNRPWDDYKDYNGLLLASERGPRDITELNVADKPMDKLFNF